MHLRSTLALSLALAAIAAVQRSEPFVPMGVWYQAGPLPASIVLGDLQTIRALGFNHVRVSVPWASVEPSPGTYRLEPLDELLALADEAALRVIVQPALEPPPQWAGTRLPDPVALASFVQAISARAANHRSFHSIGGIRDPLGISLYPRPASGRSFSPAQLAWRVDSVRSVSDIKGWRVGELQAASPGVTAADVRLWTWTAVARGARGITYAASYPEAGPTGVAGRVELVDERTRIAGDLAALISRNAALFGPLRPRASRVAILYNPLWHLADFRSAAIAHAGMATMYEQLFAWNIQADIIYPDAILAGSASSYAVVFASVPQMLPPSVQRALDAYAAAGGTVLSDPRHDLPPGAWPPDVRIDSGRGSVEARVLESTDALMLIALNHADAPHTVTFTFAPEMPEAIWQNMETGASVSFVQGPGGVTYRHAFAPRDAMVLAIRKTLR